METIRLSKPLLVNGKELNELPYDMAAITPDQFIRAENLAKGKAGDFVMGAAENDYSFHLELGFAAIMAADPSIDISDLDRVCGPDLMEVMRVGRNFTVASLAGQDEEKSESEESESEPPSESTATSTGTARTR